MRLGERVAVVAMGVNNTHGRRELLSRQVGTAYAKASGPDPSACPISTAYT